MQRVMLLRVVIGLCMCLMVPSAIPPIDTRCIDMFDRLEQKFASFEESSKRRVASLEEEVRALKKSLEAQRHLTSSDADHDDLKNALDHMWLLTCGYLVMSMQIGFAMLEAGAVRSVNGVHVLVKNVIDICLGTFCWWAFGWMMAFGADTPSASNTFAGNKGYFANGFYDVSSDGIHTPNPIHSVDPLRWFFQWAFASTAATIVSGGVAERISFRAYLIFTICITTFIYPIVVFWAWSGKGWLQGEDAKFDTGYDDFAGSGVVHVPGGVAAGLGALIVGQRETEDGTKRFDCHDTQKFEPCNVTLMVLGTLMLWFGWYGFNCGSTLGLSTTVQGQVAAHVAMNTTIAAGTGGLTVLIGCWLVAIWRGEQPKVDLPGMCHGILAGLVSITAGCNNVETYSAWGIAVIGGVIYQAVSALVRFFKVDDPLDAFAVHACCGTWGVLAAVLFDWGRGFETFNGLNNFDCTRDEADEASARCDQDAWVSAFGAQLAGISCIWLWVSGWSVLILLPLRFVGWLTVKESNKFVKPERTYYAPPEEEVILPSIEEVPATTGKKLMVQSPPPAAA